MENEVNLTIVYGFTNTMRHNTNHICDVVNAIFHIVFVLLLVLVGLNVSSLCVVRVYVQLNLNRVRQLHDTQHNCL